MSAVIKNMYKGFNVHWLFLNTHFNTHLDTVGLVIRNPGGKTMPSPLIVKGKEQKENSRYWSSLDYFHSMVGLHWEVIIVIVPAHHTQDQLERDGGKSVTSER